MKIQSSIDKTQTRPPWLDQTFQVQMTGEELVRLYLLSYEHEGGDKHATGSSRFNSVIEKNLMEQGIHVRDIAARLVDGRVV